MGIQSKQGAAFLSILSNATLVAMKLAVGLVSGSVSVLSEAAHSAIDLVASFIAFFSVRASDVPPDDEHPYGHGKIENVSGVVEALLIFVAAIYIIYEAVERLPRAIHGHIEIQPTLGIVVMCVSVLANTLISRWLFKVAKRTDSVALEADAHHLSTDVWTSMGVLGGLVLIKVLILMDLKGAAVLDSVVAIGVALLIMKVAYGLTRSAGRPLVDVRLPDEDHLRVVAVLESEVKADGPLIDYHKLRTRKAGSSRHVDVHLIVAHNLSIEQAHDFAEQVEDRIREELNGAQVVTHIEPDTEENLSDSIPKTEEDGTDDSQS